MYYNMNYKCIHTLLCTVYTTVRYRKSLPVEYFIGVLSPQIMQNWFIIDVLIQRFHGRPTGEPDIVV